MVRLAHQRFAAETGQSMAFPDKVARTLEILFRAIGRELKSDKFEVEVSSESDYDSDE